MLSLAGYNIEFFEDVSETADRGSYNRDTNTIRINVAVGTGRGGIDYVLGRTLSHELVHSIQRWNPEGYEELKGFIIEKMGDSFEGMVSRKMKRLGLSYDGAVDEVIADGCEMMLKNSKSLTEFAKEHRTLFEKICDVVEEFIGKIRNAISSLYGESTALHDEARFMELYADELQTVFDKALSDALNASEATVNHDLQSNANKKAAEDGGKVQYERWENETQKQIKLGMSDSERSKILSEKSITKLPTVKDLPDNIIQVIPDITSWEDINTLFGNKKSSLILRLAQEFGATKGNYFNKDIQISFDFSNNNFRESYHKQKVHYEQFGKMFSVFDEIIENAVGIEVHRRDNYKPDPTLERVYVMISAFEDGDQLVPVKLEIKEFKDKTNSLYVAITLQGIKKTEVSKQGTTENGVAQNSRSVTISIPDLMQVVNPSDITFTKYFPKNLLTKEQQAELAKADNLNDNNKIQYSRAEIDTENTTPEDETDIAEYREARGISLTEALKLTAETDEERAKIAEYEEKEQELNDWRAERAEAEFEREKQKADAKAFSGSFGKYRQSLMGRVNIVNGGISLDSQWQEWAELFPEHFSAETNSNDMPRVLYETIEKMKNARADDGFSLTEEEEHNRAVQLI